MPSERCTCSSFALLSAVALGMILAALTTNELTMPLALTPNLREDSVSAALSKDGEQHMMRAVLAVPPKESCSNAIHLVVSSCACIDVSQQNVSTQK